jgi:trimethylamine--corrinoid protein Co-methyltransferase
MVEESIKKIPRFGTSYARDPKNDHVFDGEHTYAHCLGGNPSMMDIDTGEVRMSTLKDVEDATRLMDALPYCHGISNLVVATDVPPQVLPIKTMEAMLKNTSKCVSGYALDEDTVDLMAKMWSCITGGLEELRKRPLFSVYGSPSSPLTWDKHASEVMIRGAEYGAPVDLVPCPICGGTAPITLAGGLAQQNAEMLSGVMLVQTVDTKISSQYSGRLSMLDLRSGKNIWGVPEMALVSAATVQIAHRYNMVADVYGVTTDVNMWDMQLGLERMMAGLLPAAAGADYLSGIGGAWGNAASYEMLVIDNEIYASIFKATEGFKVDDEHLALDVIDKVGPMGNYLAQMHTMKNIKEIRISPLFDKRTEDKAKKEGIRPLQDAARDVAKRILKEHQPMPLEKDQAADLDATVKEATKILMKRS